VTRRPRIAADEKSPAVRGFLQCAREDSNFHGPYGPQGPQPESPGVDEFSGVRGAQIAWFLDVPNRLDGVDVATVLPRLAASDPCVRNLDPTREECWVPSRSLSPSNRHRTSCRQRRTGG
jgi:hypothetical protein